MDTIKMGELIRDTRKEKKLTQKDVADKLGITDRAVSKWERGICAPDLAYMEELADMLGLTVSELISGQRMEQPPAQEVESAVKETISYSKKEMETKNRSFVKKLLAIGLGVIVVCLVFAVWQLWYSGYFYILDTVSSPNGSIVTTVYDCALADGEPPAVGGFTLRDTGGYSNSIHYGYGTYRGLWWSPNSRFRVVSMDTEDGIYLALTDYHYHSTTNLTLILEQVLTHNDFFADVAHENDKWSPIINIDFVQWSDADPETMLVYFAYTDKEGQLREGYMWYDYESHKASGYMKIEE